MQNLVFLPALFTIILAIVSKKAKTSILCGIILGSIVHAKSSWISYLFLECFWPIVAMPMKWVIFGYVLLFGVLIQLLSFSNGSKALGQKLIKHPKQLHLLAFYFGLILFFDDYFSALAVGLAFSKAFDDFAIPRYRLAFIIDSTASSVCLLAPFSTWVAFLLGIWEQDISFYWKTIPYNFYCWGIVACAFFYSSRYRPQQQLKAQALENIEDKQEHSSIRAFLWPIILLIVVLTSLMLFQTPMAISMFIAVLSSVMLAIGLCRLDCALKWNTVGMQIVHGSKAMLGTIILLILTWCYTKTMRDLGLGVFIGDFVHHNIPPTFILPLLFFFSSVISFATGSAYGTYSVMMPIGLALSTPINAPIIIASILGGGVFGDHASPVSDTTILSASSAQVPLMLHVRTQLPYALFIAFLSMMLYGFLGYFWLD